MNRVVLLCVRRGRARWLGYARLDKVTSHSGRRTFITGLAHKGVNVRVLAALAGHRNIATTQRYIELNDHVLREAVELV